MKTSFTPGPWSYGGLIGKSPGAIVANGGGVQVATAKVVPLMYGQEITSEQANANAKLIAAAPDLLEALKLAQVRLFVLDGSSAEYKAAGAAINKAVGAA